MVVATMVQQGNGKGAPHQPLTTSVTTPKKSRRRRQARLLVVLPKKFQDIIEVMYKVLVYMEVLKRNRAVDIVF